MSTMTSAKTNDSTRRWLWIPSCILTIGTFLFWRLLYPHALTYHEQFQLFLWDDDYFMGRMAEPGGLARWVAECLVQFYNNVTVGAIIIALLYLLIQIFVALLIKRNVATLPSSCQWTTFLIWSFLPVLALGYLMGDENTMLTFPVSLLMALVAMWAYTYTRAWWNQRFAFPIIISVALYWIAGPVVLMLSVFMSLFPLGKQWLKAKGQKSESEAWSVEREAIRVKSEKRKVKNAIRLNRFTFHTSRSTFNFSPLTFHSSRFLLHALFCIALGIVLILFSARILPFTTARLFRGIDYYRYPLLMPYLMMAVMALCVFVPLLPTALRHWSAKASQRFSLASATLLILCALVLSPKAYDTKTYELIRYDYLVRTQQWGKVIEWAEKHHPDLPMSVCATNLALAQTNQLGERAFQFFQKGSEGLLPHFERSFMSPLITSEAYFHLGLVNSAQRLTFECMEAIPNYNKSVRAMKRLAETNLINGQYAVAQKYLDILKKTTFYSKWAKQTETLIGNEQAINNHPLYGEKRRSHLQEDFLFSETELDKMMGQLFLQNPENSLAMQYLMLYPLLDKDIHKFMQYMNVIQQKQTYMPTLAQQGVAIAYMQQRQQPPQGLLSDIILQQCNDFSQTLSLGGKDSPTLDRFKGTLWYYLVK